MENREKVRKIIFIPANPVCILWSILVLCSVQKAKNMMLMYYFPHTRNTFLPS